MFRRARWRLTIWFAGTVALIMAVIGIAVFVSARQALFSGVDDDLEARAQREVLGPLAAQRFDPVGQEVLQIVTAGGYFYAITTPQGDVLAGTSNIDAVGLVSEEELPATGVTFINTTSSDGDDLRVMVRPIETRQGDTLFLQVGRSTEPERQAMGDLLFILFVGGAAGLALAVAGGFWLAGRALQPIQTAMDKQQEFVADASHELRTPLALIRANAEILKRDSSKPIDQSIGSVDDIIQETDRLNALVGQMLTLARAESGEPAQTFVPVHLGELAEDTAREMRLLASEKEISIVVQADGDTTVSGDALRLRELLTILLDNSVKYSEAGATIVVSILASGDKVTLKVSDNGRGIPEEELPRIFERFYRVDKARSRELGGSGLGLSIAKWIAEVHKGTIGIESKRGEGTTVTVGLPAAA